MIQWGEPLYLLALVIPVLLVVGELMSKRARDIQRSRFAALSLWPRLAPGRSTALRRTKRYLLITALVLLAVGLANPRIGTRYEEVTRQGIDIVLAVDVSRSMDSQDIRPSRLTKTKYELARFIEGMKGDRVGIVPFSGSAYPLLPLTLDYAAARMFLDLLGSDLIPSQGTNVEGAIDVALAMFPQDDEGSRSRVIVLVSDGEDHEGGAQRAAERAEKAGVSIYSIGMALAKGEPIPVFDEEGNRTSWLLDAQGEIVTSRLNEELLRTIATTTGGSYRRADQGGDAFRRLYGELFKLDKSEFETRRITGYEDRFQPILLASLLLLIIQFLLPDQRRRKNGIKVAGALLLLGMLALPIASLAENPHELVKEGNKAVIDKQLDQALTRYLEAKAAVDSTRPEIDYNLGGVYARKGDLARADSLYNSLPEDARRSLRSRAAYNRGTAYANAEQFDKAVPSFIDALRLNPKDQDAKMNLELALRKMQEQQNQQNQDNDDQQDNQDQQDQDQQQQQQGDENQDEQNQQQNQDGEQDDEQQDQQQNPQDQQDEQNQDQQQPQPQQTQQEMDKELAERLLDQLQQDEKQLLKEVVRKQIPQQQKNSAKPW
ncbi:VWA domain-containing protein [bacterium]|nr:VWA domain-containing protein [bacterium]